jgi:hypothetical protein
MTPNPANLYLGAGEVWFDRFDASGNPTDILRHLGNVDTLALTPTVDTIVKKSAMSGARGILAEVPTASELEVSLAMSEFESNNIALALIGSEAAFLQTAEATVTDRSISASLVLDVWYNLKTVDGKAAFNPTVTAFKQGATTLNAAAYEYRAEAGMVKFLSSYVGTNNAQAGLATTWTGSIPVFNAASNKRVVQALAVGIVKGRLRYISASDQAQGPRIVVDVWKCTLSPDGDIALIGEDFGTFNLKGKVALDASKPVGSQYVQVMYL